MLSINYSNTDLIWSLLLLFLHFDRFNHCKWVKKKTFKSSQIWVWTTRQERGTNWWRGRVWRGQFQWPKRRKRNRNEVTNNPNYIKKSFWCKYNDVNNAKDRACECVCVYILYIERAFILKQILPRNRYLFTFFYILMRIQENIRHQIIITTGIEVVSCHTYTRTHKCHICFVRPLYISLSSAFPTCFSDRSRKRQKLFRMPSYTFCPYTSAFHTRIWVYKYM